MSIRELLMQSTTAALMPIFAGSIKITCHSKLPNLNTSRTSAIHDTAVSPPPSSGAIGQDP